MKKVIHTDKAPKAVGPYSQAVQMGDFLFCSGQISIDPMTNEVFTGDIKKQTDMVMSNVSSVLSAAGLNFSNVVKTTIFLTDMNDFATVNEIYAKYFSEGEEKLSHLDDYTSHNTDRLSVEQIKQLLLKLDYIKKELHA